MVEFESSEKPFKYSIIFYIVIIFDLFVSFVFGITGVYSYLFGIITGPQSFIRLLLLYLIIILFINFGLDLYILNNKKKSPNTINIHICLIKGIFGLFGVITGVAGLYFLITNKALRPYDVIKIKRPPSDELSYDKIPSDDSRYIPTEVKKIVMARDKGRCVICGSRHHIEFDHDIPVSLGGSNTENNIRLLCKHCNRKKSGRIE